MALAPAGNVPAIFDLKSATLSLVAVVLKTADLTALSRELAARYADTPGLFNHDPVVIDLSALRQADTAVDFASLIGTLRRNRLQPVAVKGGSPAQMQSAQSVGLGAAPETAPAAVRVETVVKEVVREVVKEVVREVPKPGPGTMLIDKPLRSGQQIYAKGCDLVVMSAVNHGAEVIADGHIHVYAPLRGRAIAGARGNNSSRIFTTCLEPELIAIAGIYRTAETAIPAEVHGKPAQIRLVGERLVIEPLES